MHKAILFLATLFLLTAQSVLQADNHPTTDQSNAQLIQKELLATLAAATTEIDGRLAESAVWEFWFDKAPTPDVRKLLDAGRERIQAYDYEAAENILNQVVEAAPDYAEGYNQRAFARFLREKYTESQSDLEKTLALEPDHFGALSGMYHILRIQSRTQAAMNMLRKAVTIHPWIQERGALPESMWPESYRKLHEPGLEI